MKKKICFCIDTLGRGGAERVMSNLANGFAKNKYEVFFICNWHADKEYDLVKNINKIFLCDAIRLSKYNCIAKIQQMLFLRKFLKENNIDVGIAFMGGNNFALLGATLFTNIKRIVSVRNLPTAEYPTVLHKILYTLLFPTASKIVFQTTEEKKYFNKKIQRLGIIIYNPISDRFFHNDKRVQGTDIVNVGRLVPQKNQKMLIKAFSCIKDSYPKIKLQIYGDGYLKSELEEYIQVLGISDCVYLNNSVKDIENHIKDAAMFVMTSNNEGMPNALMEAMALGLPVISTDCGGGGPRELIRHKQNGLLIKNQQELIKAMKFILDNSNYGEMLGKNAKQSANSFHEAKVFSAWEKLINEI